MQTKKFFIIAFIVGITAVALASNRVIDHEERWTDTFLNSGFRYMSIERAGEDKDGPISCTANTSSQIDNWPTKGKFTQTRADTYLSSGNNNPRYKTSYNSVSAIWIAWQPTPNKDIARDTRRGSVMDSTFISGETNGFEDVVYIAGCTSAWMAASGYDPTLDVNHSAYTYAPSSPRNVYIDGVKQP